jgi:hypothetical protein
MGVTGIRKPGSFYFFKESPSFKRIDMIPGEK